MRLSSKLTFICLLLLVLATGFQNCGEVNFTSEEPISSSAAVCPPGQTLVDEECTTLNTIFTECLSFQSLDELTEIPSLEATGVCYYKQLLSALPPGPSGSRGEELALDVYARKHGNDNRLSAPAGTHPFIMGDALIELMLQGARTLSLTSSSVGNVDSIENHKLKVDNFVLIEYSAINGSGVFARGTADAEPNAHPEENPLGKILLQGVNGIWQPVLDFISYAPGGTAEVDVISLGTISPGQLTLRTRMLDCGGSAEASDMYLVIH